MWLDVDYPSMPELTRGRCSVFRCTWSCEVSLLRLIFLVLICSWPWVLLLLNWSCSSCFAVCQTDEINKYVNNFARVVSSVVTKFTHFLSWMNHVRSKLSTWLVIPNRRHTSVTDVGRGKLSNALTFPESKATPLAEILCQYSKAFDHQQRRNYTQVS